MIDMTGTITFNARIIHKDGRRTILCARPASPGPTLDRDFHMEIRSPMTLDTGAKGVVHARFNAPAGAGETALLLSDPLSGEVLHGIWVQPDL